MYVKSNTGQTNVVYAPTLSTYVSNVLGKLYLRLNVFKHFHIWAVTCESVRLCREDYFDAGTKRYNGTFLFVSMISNQGGYLPQGPHRLYYSYLLMFYWERASVSLLIFSVKQGNYWYHFNVFGVTRSLTQDWTRDLSHSMPALYH